LKRGSQMTKEKVIYTRWLANALVKAGFPVVRVD
jgi:hypothetical protein